MKTESPGVAQAILAVWGSATVKRSISSSLQPIRAVSNLDFDNAHVACHESKSVEKLKTVASSCELISSLTDCWVCHKLFLAL